MDKEDIEDMGLLFFCSLIAIWGFILLLWAVLEFIN